MYAVPLSHIGIGTVFKQRPRHSQAETETLRHKRSRVRIATSEKPSRLCIRWNCKSAIADCHEGTVKCLSVVYIILGTIIFTSILQPPKFSQNDSLNEIYYKIMIYRGNDFLLRSLTVILLTVNLVQIVSDLLVIDGTLKGRNGKHYWICFTLDILLWLISLICFVMMFYGSGFLLLIIVLFGTAIRGFILYLLHEFITQLRKANDSSEILVIA